MLTTSEIVIIPSVFLFVISMGLLLGTVVTLVVWTMYQRAKAVDTHERQTDEIRELKKDNEYLQGVIVSSPTEHELPKIKRTGGPDLLTDTLSHRLMKQPPHAEDSPIKYAIYDEATGAVECYDNPKILTEDHLLTEYSGPFHDVHHKVLQVYHGQWHLKNNSQALGQNKVIRIAAFHKNPLIP